MRLINIWKSSQTNLTHLVTSFIKQLEDGKEKFAIHTLNALIAKMKETLYEGIFVAK